MVSQKRNKERTVISHFFCLFAIMCNQSLIIVLKPGEVLFLLLWPHHRPTRKCNFNLPSSFRLKGLSFLIIIVISFRRAFSIIISFVYFVETLQLFFDIVWLVISVQIVLTKCLLLLLLFDWQSHKQFVSLLLVSCLSLL